MTEKLPILPVLRGKLPQAHEKEFLEMRNYESGDADKDASKIAGPFQNPWLNVVHACEPVSIPSYEKIISTPLLRRHIKGRVMDVAAGSCWLSGKVSKIPEVQEVFAVDLSERFLTTSGVQCMHSVEAILGKVKLVASDFNALPIESDSIDCAFLFAALHHSLSPIKTLQEIGRCLKPGGVLFVLENPPAAINIRKVRRRNLEITTGVSEIAYTLEELEYVMDNARIGSRIRYTFDILSRKGWRYAVRKLLRKCQMEHLLMNPPTYLFVIEKK